MMASADNIRGLARLWRSYTGMYSREDFNGGAGLEKGCPGKERTSGQPENIQVPALVVDPVLQSGTGVDLLASGGVDAYFRDLFPLAAVFTPNVPEALTGLKKSAKPSTWNAPRRLSWTREHSGCCLRAGTCPFQQRAG